MADFTTKVRCAESEATMEASHRLMAEEDSFELVIRYPKPNHAVEGHPKAYYSKELEDFYKSGELNDVVKGFFRKFANKESSSSSLTITNIQNLTDYRII